MSRRILSQLLPLVLLLLICVPPQPGAATPAPAPAPVPDPGLTDLLGSLPIVGDVLKLVGNVGNAPPPTLLWTRNPSPQCAAINQGELLCCRGALAGDQPLVVFLAGVYGYKLNPNDVNGLVCTFITSSCLPTLNSFFAWLIGVCLVRLDVIHLSAMHCFGDERHQIKQVLKWGWPACANTTSYR